MKTQIKNKIAKQLIAEAENVMNIKILKINTAEIMRVETEKILIVNKEPILIIDEKIGSYLPYITGLDKFIFCPYVTVDMGAVPYIVNGAQVMIPGIIEKQHFQKDEFVQIKEEKYLKTLAVGKAIVSSDEIINTNKGKAIKNQHFIGDIYWNAGKNI